MHTMLYNVRCEFLPKYTRREAGNKTINVNIF